MTKQELMKIAEGRIVKEMEEVGYIDDSDMVERFLDNLAYELVGDDELSINDDEVQEVLENIKESCIKDKYRLISEVDERANFTGYYVPFDSKYKTIEDFEEI